MLPRETLAHPKFSISINGKTVGEDLLKFVLGVNVEESDDALPTATITINDVERKWLNDVSIVDGTKITIAMGHLAKMRSVFNGYITYIEGDMNESNLTTLKILCTDMAKGLLKDKKARSWKKRKVSEIIALLHKEEGVSIVVQDTKVVLDQIVQEDSTNFDFIMNWKKRLGARYYKMDSKTYYFGTKPRNSGAIENLSYQTLGHEILTFAPVYQEVDDSESEQSEIDDEGNTITSKSPKQPSYSGLGGAPVGKASTKKK